MNQNIEYEKLTQEIYQELINAQGISTINVQHNIKIRGKSGQKHQIDVYWEYTKDGVQHNVIIECKNYNSEIPIGKVRDFLGLLSDLTNVSGIMITKVGYQKGAKKYADYYGINLKELRKADGEEALVGEINIDIGIIYTERLFSLDKEWAEENNINWSLCRSRIADFSGRGNEWGEDYLPLETTKDANILDAKGQLVITLDELMDKLIRENESIYYFEDAYIDTRYWGRVKLQAFKCIKNETREIKKIGIDARNIVKAILKDALNGEIIFFCKDINTK